MKTVFPHILRFCSVHRFELILGLIGLLVLHGGLLFVESDRIESELEQTVDTTLQLRGFNRISVSANGRDMMLSGAVSSESAEQAAIFLSASIPGVRIVRSQLQIKALRLPHVIVSRTTDGHLRVEGELVDEIQVQHVIELAKQSFMHNDFSQSIRTNPEVTEAKWYGSVAGMFQEANQLQSLVIELGAGVIAVGGLVESESDYRVFDQRMRQFVEDSEHEYINRVGIMPKDASSEPTVGGSNEEASTFVSSVVVEDDSVQSQSVSDQSEGTTVEIQNQDLSTDSAAADLMAVELIEQSDDINPKINSDKVSKLIEITEMEDGIQPDVPLDTSTAGESLEPLERLEDCQQQLRQSILYEPIVFASGDASVTDDNIQSIDNIGKILNDYNGYKILVAGHTDSVGNDEDNLLLSQLRADRVRARLIETGLESNRIRAQGFGSTQPIANNETAHGRNLNRRIEFILDI